jgi:uncharacterized phage-associated protein
LCIISLRREGRFMPRALDVACFFIEITHSSKSDMTNLKLNKLLYFAQGTSLAKTGNVLFDEDFEAWKLGPVVPSVYRAYKTYGDNPIPVSECEDARSLFTDEQYSLLLDVAREYLKAPASNLVDETHQPGTPWKKYYVSGKNHAVIPTCDIKNYFSKNGKVIQFDEILEKAPITITEGRRNSSGVLVLPNTELDDGWLVLDEM